MKTAIFTLNVNNYLPAITKYTLKHIEAYAQKCGAEFHVLTESPFSGWPVTYQKLQIHELSKNYSAVAHIDADMLIDYRRFWNIFEHLDPRSVACHATYTASVWFKCDEYFYRDDRNLGLCSSFMVAPISCRDVWTPFDLSLEEASQGISRLHGIDDYCFSRNAAKFGLKVQGVVNETNEDCLVHLSGSGGNLDPEGISSIEKHAHETLTRWGYVK